MLAVLSVPFSGAVVFSAIDPVWATPVNTALLIIMAALGYVMNKRGKRVEEKVHDIHTDVGHAAAAASSAAEAAAAAARISKELGGVARHVEIPDPPEGS